MRSWSADTIRSASVNDNEAPAGRSGVWSDSLPEKHDAAVQERYDTVKKELRDIKVQEELSDLSQKIR